MACVITNVLLISHGIHDKMLFHSKQNFAHCDIEEGITRCVSMHPHVNTISAYQYSTYGYNKIFIHVNSWTMKHMLIISKTELNILSSKRLHFI